MSGFLQRHELDSGVKMATYTIEVDDALVDGLSAMLPIMEAADIKTMISNAATQLGKQGLDRIRVNNAQTINNALAQGMTPAQAAALIG